MKRSIHLFWLLALLVAWAGFAWAVELTPEEGCSCPPDPSAFEFDTYGIVSDPSLKLPINLQGWSRLGIEAGLAPDSQGYLREKGKGLCKEVRGFQIYGTCVDLMVDLTGDGMGRECWAGNYSSFSVLNLVDEIVREISDSGSSGVLLKIPATWLVAFAVKASEPTGDGTCGELITLGEETRRGSRVQNLIYRLRGAEPFKSGRADINIYATSQGVKTVDVEALATLQDGVSRILIELPNPSWSTCRWEMALLNRSCRLDLMKPEDEKVIPVVGPGCMSSEKPASETFFSIALDLGFKGLAMEVTEANAEVFLNYNKKRLEGQEDFFAGLVWSTGLADALCWRRPLILISILALGGAFFVAGVLALFFCSVRQLAGRYPRVVIGACFLFVGLIWLYEAVEPTVNSWTNEAIFLIFLTTCVAMGLVWLRNRQKERFP